MFNVQCAFECMWWTVTDPQYPLYDFGSTVHSNVVLVSLPLFEIIIKCMGYWVCMSLPLYQTKLPFKQTCRRYFCIFFGHLFTRLVRTKQNTTVQKEPISFNNAIALYFADGVSFVLLHSVDWISCSSHLWLIINAKF